MAIKNIYSYHIIAIVVVSIWGLTFISTKLLLGEGLSPQDIFLLRFLIAYVGIWFISPKKIMSKSWRESFGLSEEELPGDHYIFWQRIPP